MCKTARAMRPARSWLASRCRAARCRREPGGEHGMSLSAKCRKIANSPRKVCAARHKTPCRPTQDDVPPDTKRCVARHKTMCRPTQDDASSDTKQCAARSACNHTAGAWFGYHIGRNIIRGNIWRKARADSRGQRPRATRTYTTGTARRSQGHLTAVARAAAPAVATPAVPVRAAPAAAETAAGARGSAQYGPRASPSVIH